MFPLTKCFFKLNLIFVYFLLTIFYIPPIYILKYFFYIQHPRV